MNNSAEKKIKKNRFWTCCVNSVKTVSEQKQVVIESKSLNTRNTPNTTIEMMKRKKSAATIRNAVLATENKQFQSKVHIFYTKTTLAQCIFHCMNANEMLVYDDYVNI